MAASPVTIAQSRRRVAIVATDAALVVAANYLAFWLRFDGDIPAAYWAMWLATIPSLLVIRALTFLPLHVYDGVWKYVGVRDLRSIVVGVFASTAVFYALIHAVFRLTAYPRSVFLIDAALLICLLGGVRMGWRLRPEWRRLPRARRVLIYGAGDAGEMILREVLNGRDPERHPIGFVDDDPVKVGQRIHGVPVLGTRHDLPKIMAHQNPGEMLIATPGASPEALRAIVREMKGYQLPIKTLPPLRDILDGRVPLEEAHDLAVERLLGRGPVGLDMEAARAFVGSRQMLVTGTVLVTGGAGYVGSWLTRKLLDRGYRVRVLDSFLYNDRGLSEILSHPRLDIFEGDIRHLGTLTRATKDVEGVIALAALVGDAACDLDTEETMATNFASVDLLRDVCRRQGVRRLVFASSCSVYGANSDLMLNEGSWLNPVSLYARTRMQSEDILLRQADDIEVVILRLATVFGLSTRMRFDLLVNTLTLEATVNGKMRVFGGNQWRPNLHCQDAAEAFITALEAPADRAHRGIFNVGANENNHTVLEVAEMVKRRVPASDIEINSEQGDRRDYRVSFDKIRQVLGFQPRFTVADGIREIADALAAGTIRDPFADIYHNYRHLKQQASWPTPKLTRRVATATVAR